MFVSIKNVNNNIYVKTQYNPDFNVAARQIGGRFDYDETAWVFDDRNKNLLRDKLLSIFGTDGYEQSCVDVEIAVKKTIIAEQEPIYLAGRMIARATGKNSRARAGEKIAFIQKSAISSGSAKNWTTEIKDGAVFRILDLYEGAVKFLDECEAIEYKIINKTSNKDAELAMLKQELKRITDRIAELEQ
jgi:hypothetical protein